MTSSQPTGTDPSTRRRKLRFDDIAQITEEADRLQQGGYRARGQWSLGQASAHLAVLMECSLDGFPFRMPFYWRALGVFLKKHTLERGMPSGVGFPGPSRATLTPPEISDEAGVDRLRRAIARLQHEPQRAASPLLGKLSVDEWNAFHCRHAELHLGFLVPSDQGTEEAPDGKSAG